jgi:hypothetical protein
MTIVLVSQGHECFIIGFGAENSCFHLECFLKEAIAASYKEN